MKNKYLNQDHVREELDQRKLILYEILTHTNAWVGLALYLC